MSKFSRDLEMVLLSLELNMEWEGHSPWRGGKKEKWEKWELNSHTFG